MSKFADLHIHTFYSDSTSSPEEVVNEALDAKLSCIAITDHDTIDGIEPTMNLAKARGLEVLTGVELSTEVDGKDIHLLAYCFDPRNPALLSVIAQAQDGRVERMRQMIAKLKTLGVNNIEFDEVSALAHSRSLGRPHLATMLKEKGWVSDLSQAFHKYIGEEAPAYVSKFKLSPFDAIKLVRDAGGVTVLAHPMITNRDELLPAFVEAGLQGIEVYYPNYPPISIEYYEKLARKYNLVMTGGSDAHGKAKTNTYIGRAKIPYELVEKLKAAAKIVQV